MPAGISEFLRAQAAHRGVALVPSTQATLRGEQALWRACVSWGVNPMPHKIIATAEDGAVVGASYYSDTGFLSALAVLPAHRGRNLGRLLIAATLSDMKSRLGCRSSNLHVLKCDASPERFHALTCVCHPRLRWSDRHGLYTSCGYVGGDPSRGGDYLMSCIPDGVEETVMAAGRS